MSDVEEEYQNTINKVEEKLRKLESIPSTEWQLLDNNDTESSIQTYTHVTNNVTTFKIDKELDSTETDIEHFTACFKSFHIRQKWYPGLKDIKLIEKINKDINIVQLKLMEDSRTSDITCFEKITNQSSSVQYMTSSLVDDQPYFLVCTIENSKSNGARAIVYYETIQSFSNLLTLLIQIPPFPYIIKQDPIITILNSSFIDKSFEIEYQVGSILIHGIDIQPKINRTPPWPTDTWDPPDPTRKNKFMSPSLVFASSYPNPSGSLWKVELQVMTPYIPRLVVFHGRSNARCDKIDHRYRITIYHPEDPTQLKISFTPDDHFSLNGLKYPIHHGSQEDHLDFPLPEEDVFLDGMEFQDDDDPQDVLVSDTPALIPPLDLDDPKITLSDIKPEIKLETKPDIEDTSKLSITHKEEIDEEKTLEIKIPEGDPVALQTAYQKFLNYLQPTFQPTPTVIQVPNKENGHVIVKKLDIPDHPLGGFLSESTWKDCSIWDIKAVLENAGARKIWDSTFESNTFLHTLTGTSALWHTKMKGAWPVSPRDYVLFHGQYSTATYRVDLLSTSCIGDAFQYKALPNKEVPGYVRATADVLGWRLERLDDHTASVKQLIVTQFPTWVVHFITSRFIVQTAASVAAAQQFLTQHGAPPSLEHLSSAQLVNLKYDHERHNWRCEYTRRLELEGAPTSCYIRLDRRRWALKYGIVIDPPPSRVSALERVCDPYGIWLTVEHDEAFIIPLRGKILVLIKPDESSSTELNVNGVSTPIEKEKRVAIVVEPVLPVETVQVPLTEDEKAISALHQLPRSPQDHARAGLAFLKQTDEQFGWTVVTDNPKQALRISKKAGLKQTSELPDDKLKIYEPYTIYKGSKVIENFDLDDVRSVVADLHHVRSTYDDTLEGPIEIVHETDTCRVIRQQLKAVFPFKNREIYAVSCLAEDPIGKRVFYLESSLPDFPLINKAKTRGHLFISGWILEPIDPYTTTANHPIPSTRLTYVASLDLGVSVPSYISNLVVSNWFPKKLQAIEHYLKHQGPPPSVSNMAVYANHQLKPAPRLSTVYDGHLFKAIHHLEAAGDQPILQIQLDLRPYPAGYDIQAQLYQIKDRRKNMTHQASLTISEPPVPHLMDERRLKHVVTVVGHGLAGQYEFEFSLSPIREEMVKPQLTVSHVLGELKEGWAGLVVVNGVKVGLDQEVVLKSSEEPEEPIEVFSEEPEEIVTTNQYMGGSVVATALGNVSAGVNNIGARMMIPFRAASNSFLSRDENEMAIESSKRDEAEITSSDEENEDGGVKRRFRRFTEEERSRIDASTTVHEVRVLRRSSDTVRKGILLFLICLGLAVVFALLMLQPLLKRFNSSVAIWPIETSVENRVVQPLLQMPWFGGWDIQVIAIRRELP